MLLKTILNDVEKHPLFIYGTAKIIKNDGHKRIEIPIKARKRSKGICSSCHKTALDTICRPLEGFHLYRYGDF